MAPSEGAQSLLQQILKRSESTPRILWWQAKEILYKLQRRQRNDDKKHPCVSTWYKLVRCMRRFPHNYVSKCAGEASRHYQCTVKNDGWTIDDGVNYTRIMESFDIFNTRKPDIYTGDEIRRVGMASSNSFLPEKEMKR
ncbi:uncharacterized protein BBOV_IV010660 [Babesia bovis T2Bo]|uniref:Uncharacterized protein n=1 Tax=Babesia bovis TaxID=5865 RepID=A7ASA0_BABBO|nr:uncharacterized protein BBOV_IV010660 [Babesia bovis T2Bo]EDO07419.1 hypothetical protein BBOV_IV010660 [Babesia bovis T2Bo]|eukprot:XP_001610987.1 hypothetical protein [Babesia bovis T2Bo]